MSMTRHAVADWDGNPAPEAPIAPDTLKEAGLSLGFICDMILRTLYTRGAMLGRDLAQLLCLPFKVIREPLKFLKDEKCIEVDGGDLVGEVSYRFSLTDLGRKRAQDAMEQCAYVGPAPVPLEDYVEQCYRQTVTGLQCYPEALRGAVRPPRAQGGDVQRRRPGDRQRPERVHLRPARQRQDRDGPRHRRLHEHRRRRDLHSLRLRRRRQHHHRVRPVAARHRRHRRRSTATRPTRRFASCSPPARWISAGSASAGRSSSPAANSTSTCSTCATTPEANFYQAPMHVKANGGVFLIDDFGRQLCSPKELLNRWILPLEDRHDFLTVASGKKFQVPFEQLIIFSTNLDPKDLVDDAFLRRIRHKVGVNAPAARRLREDLRRRTASGWA